MTWADIALMRINKTAEHFDRDFCTVMARRREPCFVEREPHEANAKSIAHDIASGEIADALVVFQFNPVESTARNISEDIALDVMREHLDAYGEVQSWVRDFLEDHLGCRRVADAEREHVS